MVKRAAVLREPGDVELHRRGIDRLVFFSDAVVAIAITLIVLPLVDDARNVGDASVWLFLHEHSADLVSAGVSFYAIAAFWLHHHGLFGRATGYTTVLLWSNMLWLAGIVFLPIATVLQVGPSSARGGTVLYLATLTFIMVVSRVQSMVLVRSGLLADTAEHLRSRIRWTTWIPPVILGLATIAVAVFPRIGLWALTGLALQRPLERLSRP